ncbi:uncharacterized protein LOC110855792 isoform X3 [Folsomia candida]|uniref:Putative helicase 22 n=1 Tax=Folsomia candida TaxID=158441 RepID=A0A226DQ53_FOLCA|nr:uncharacterized protein LOC110855792 isoform X3 [Folsomia candida]OXA47210.1 putative helicase 22 [Folsomia candida]
MSIPQGGVAALREKARNKPKPISKFEENCPLFTQALKDELVKILNPKANQETNLHDYQIKAVLNTAEHFGKPLDPDRNERSAALIVAPPGSGKSGMVALLPYVLNSHKVLVLTPSRIISEQIAADFGYKFDGKGLPFIIKCGLFNVEDNYEVMLETVHLCDLKKNKDIQNGQNLVIAKAQIFAGRAKNSLTSDKSRDDVAKVLQSFDTIIVDEAHHCTAQTWENVINCFEGRKIVFLTATPFSGNESLLSILGDKLEEVFTIRRAEVEGVTIRKSDFTFNPMKHKPFDDPDFFGDLRNDIDEALGRHVAQENRNVGEHSPQAMILVTTMKQAEETAEALGRDATFVISAAEGDANLKQFNKGDKKIAVVCGMLREGYDNSRVTLVVFIRNCGSRVLFEQFCGRCIRMNRNLANVTRSEMGKDKTIGTILSYQCYPGIKKFWEERDKPIADVEPDYEDNGNDE